MSEQQYRVVADRDKGDNPVWNHTEIGDRFIHVGILGGESQLVRIERPVPIEHCLSTAHHDGHEWGGHEGQTATGYWCPGFDASDEKPSVPTREQIATVYASAVSSQLSPGEFVDALDVLGVATRD